MKRKVKVALIASGSGSDANSVMTAYRQGFIPNIEIEMLISTAVNAGCLAKAKSHGIRRHVIEKKGKTLDEFNAELREFLLRYNIELVFLVGCVVKIIPFFSFKMNNIHPADPEKFGGDGMYGLEVHRRVIMDIFDRIKRGKATIHDRFFTVPTVHEAILEYDSGAILLQANVEIPKRIITGFYADVMLDKSKMDARLNQAAEELQQHVLPYEWLMLPTAVQMAAKKIIDQEAENV